MEISRLHPATTRIKQRVALTKMGSTKYTAHIVLDTKTTPVSFKVGDSVGIYPQNDPQLVSHLLDAIGATGEEEIIDPRQQTPTSLRLFLLHKANLARLTSSFLKLIYTQRCSAQEQHRLSRLLDPEHKALLTDYLASHDPLDLLKEYKDVRPPLQELCNQFGPLLPRFYSIASSPLVYPDEIHLTVNLFTFAVNEVTRYGVGSHFLCSLATPQETPIPFYIQPTAHFTLPSDDTTPIILIGPGTGIAPYRAFIQERIARGAPGKIWLFFGERHRATDYLYQEELEQWNQEKKIRLDLAFSRDQTDKLYVQHLLLRHSRTLWKWLQEGALLYVCGDAHRMAKDVDHTLHQIAAQEGNLDELTARHYITDLRRAKRYLTDVY